jgi:hypothetical protein
MIALGFVVIKAYRPDFPLSEEQVSNLVYTLMAYILCVALEDALTASRGAMIKVPETAERQ